MNPFENTPFADFLALAAPDFDVLALSDEELASLHTDLDATIAEVAATPAEFVGADFTTAQLMDVTRLAVAKRDELKAELARRDEVAKADAAAADFAELAKKDDEPPADEPDAPEKPEAEAEAAADPIVAAALPEPTADRTPTPHDPPARTIPLVAAAGARDVDPGTPFRDELELAESMIRRHSDFGRAGKEVVEKFTIARASWKDEYPEDRRLGTNEEANWDLIRPVMSHPEIRRQFEKRIHEQDQGLVASGGLCAPVTPYYNLQFISTPTRPVMASLPSFSADRGGLRYARPAALSSVTTAVGLLTAAQDGQGGTFATKTCQVIPCPPFQETDVNIIYHCLQFGNLGARVFPELVAQWNNLVLAAHARLAESALLTAIDGFSTQVTAGALNLGASATLFSQILAAGDGMRSRHRMATDAVLRVMLPFWAVDLIISDVIRTQFERFDTDAAKVTALFRQFNVEPTFYMDGANGRAQVFGTQNAGGLLPFPANVVWYLFPEGSFIFLDGGQLELGIVRDSVLNKTNDFQIFGETFENVAYVGVESLAVVSTVCDSGTVALPRQVTCPITY